MSPRIVGLFLVTCLSIYANAAQPNCQAIFKDGAERSKAARRFGQSIFLNRADQGLEARERIEVVRNFTEYTERIRRDDTAWRLLNQTEKPPSGRLSPVDPGVPTQKGGGQLYRDANGEIFILKRDDTKSGLLSSTELVSTGIYRHFGFYAPEVFLVTIDGVRYSATRPLPNGKDIALKDAPDSKEMRRLKFVAAFLQDQGFLKDQPRLRLFADGSFAVFNIEGSLGQDGQGESIRGGPYKMPDIDATYGKPIGSTADEQWAGGHPMKALYDSYSIDALPKGHPWKLASADDAKPVVALFRTLDYDKISELVNRAETKSFQDKRELVGSLRIRRNAYLEYLIDYLGAKEDVDTRSYWAQFVPLEDLSFDVAENRSPQIGVDIQKFLQNHVEKPGEMILFRGQENLTREILAPAARELKRDGKPIPNVEGIRNRVKNHMAQTRLELNWKRQEAYLDLRGEDYDKTGELLWWERATAMDAFAFLHSISNGQPLLISATRALRVASRWIENPRFPTRYRYIYILSVPKKNTVPITASLLFKHGANRESEIGIFLDATPNVIAVYDTVESKFVNLPPAE